MTQEVGNNAINAVLWKFAVCSDRPLQNVFFKNYDTHVNSKQKTTEKVNSLNYSKRNFILSETGIIFHKANEKQCKLFLENIFCNLTYKVLNTSFQNNSV